MSPYIPPPPPPPEEPLIPIEWRPIETDSGPGYGAELRTWLDRTRSAVLLPVRMPDDPGPARTFRLVVDGEIIQILAGQDLETARTVSERTLRAAYPQCFKRPAELMARMEDYR